MHGRRELAGERRDRQDVLAAVAVLLVMFQLQGPDDLIAEPEWDDHEALHLERRVRDAPVPGDIVDDDGLAVRRHLVAEVLRV